MARDRDTGYARPAYSEEWRYRGSGYDPESEDYRRGEDWQRQDRDWYDQESGRRYAGERESFAERGRGSWGGYGRGYEGRPWQDRDTEYRGGGEGAYGPGSQYYEGGQRGYGEGGRYSQGERYEGRPRGGYQRFESYNQDRGRWEARPGGGQYGPWRMAEEEGGYRRPRGPELGQRDWDYPSERSGNWRYPEWTAERPGSGGSRMSGDIYGYREGQGQYSGRGPKGYQRADDRICEDVCEALTEHGGIDASEIDVEVHDGEVVLKGYVDERRQKRMAEDAVEDLAGVTDVRNEIRVHHDVAVVHGPGETGSMGGSMGQPGRARMAGQQGMGGAGSRGSSGGGTATMAGGQPLVGQPVYALDGTMLGSVKAVEAGRFKLDAPMRPDYWLSREAISSTGREGLTLRTNEGDLDQYRRDGD